MFHKFVSKLWLSLPPSLRRSTMRFSNTRFTVTAGALIFNGKGEVLLLKHLFRAGTGWGMPGGFMESGEQPEETLRRELREEVGIEVTSVRLFAARSFKKPRQVEIVFVCRSNGDARPRSVEIEQAGWFRPEALPDGLALDQRQLIQRAVADGANQHD